MQDILRHSNQTFPLWLAVSIYSISQQNPFPKVSEVSVFWRFSENRDTQIIVIIIETSEKPFYFFKLERQAKHKVIVLMIFNHLVHLQKQYWTIKTNDSEAGGLEKKYNNDLISLPNCELHGFTGLHDLNYWQTSSLSWISLSEEGINIKNFSKNWSVLFSYS